MCSAACPDSRARTAARPAQPSGSPLWHLPEPYLPARSGAGHGGRSAGEPLPRGREENSLLPPPPFPLGFSSLWSSPFWHVRRGKPVPAWGPAWLSALSPKQHVGLTRALRWARSQQWCSPHRGKTRITRNLSGFPLSCAACVWSGPESCFSASHLQEAGGFFSKQAFICPATVLNSKGVLS